MHLLWDGEHAPTGSVAPHAGLPRNVFPTRHDRCPSPLLGNWRRAVRWHFHERPASLAGILAKLATELDHNYLPAGPIARDRRSIVRNSGIRLETQRRTGLVSAGDFPDDGSDIEGACNVYASCDAGQYALSCAVSSTPNQVDCRCEVDGELTREFQLDNRGRNSAVDVNDEPLFALNTLCGLNLSSE